MPPTGSQTAQAAMAAWGAVAFAVTVLEQRDSLHENSPPSPGTVPLS